MGFSRGVCYPRCDLTIMDTPCSVTFRPAHLKLVPDKFHLLLHVTIRSLPLH